MRALLFSEWLLCAAFLDSCRGNKVKLCTQPHEHYLSLQFFKGINCIRRSLPSTNDNLEAAAMTQVKCVTVVTFGHLLLVWVGFFKSIIFYRSILATRGMISPWTQHDLFRREKANEIQLTFWLKISIYFTKIIWSIYSLPVGRNLSLLPDNFHLRHPICLYLQVGVRGRNLIKLSRCSLFFF